MSNSEDAGARADPCPEDQRELETVRAKLAAAIAQMDEFAGIVSHDLQEPLRVASGYLDLLQRKASQQLDEKTRGYVQEAIAALERMKTLLTGLLEYARIQSRAQDSVSRDAGVALNQALMNLTVAADESGAQITHDAMPMVLADPVQLVQLFQNLVANGIKFRRNGTNPVIHIGATARGRQWEFRVSDNGIGVAPKDHRRLFVVFQRLHGQEIAGIGMGLALCKRIVERAGGRIWIETEDRPGTTICFTLQDGTSVPAVPANTTVRIVRIVLADDVPTLRSLVKISLEEYSDGCFVVVGEANDGVEAIEAARMHQPDLVLLDVSMPNMDGLEALPHIREAAPASKVIMFSGFMASRMLSTSVQQGAAGYLEKGLPPAELVKRIQQILDDAASSEVAPSAGMAH